MAGIRQWAEGQWRRSVLHRALLVAPPVVLLLLLGFWRFGGRNNVQYYTARVESGDVIQVVQATGTINAVTTVQVGSQVSGTIAELFVDFNSKVKKGQVIAQIDPAILQTRLLQAEADLENARANVKSLEAQIDTQRADVQAAKAGVDRAQAQLTEADLNLKRTEQLFAEGVVAAAQRDSAKANYDGMLASLKVTEAQHDQAKARLKAMQAQLEQAKAQVAQRKAAAEMSRVDLGHTVIRAPIDGTVIARNVDVGQTVAASLQAPTLFVIAQDLTKMQVYAKTDEADVGKIQPGAVARFRVDSFPRDEFRGRVAQVRMNATMVQNVVTYDTIIEFDNPDQKLFPGMTAYVTIPVAWANDVVKVPNGALRFKPDLTADELRALYEKHGIQAEEAAQRRRGSGGGNSGGSGGGGPVTRGNRGGSGVAQGGGETSGGGGQRRMAGPGAGRPENGVVWKLDASRNLIPVAVKIGVTDFAFTELKEGSLEPGTELVIGQSSGRSAQQRTLPGQQGGGMGGLPRRM
jgi:HlyD family secretion protein